MTRGRKTVAVLAGLPLAFGVVLAVEAWVATRREYFDTPGYTVEGTVQPSQPGGGEAIELVMLGDSTVAGLGAERVEDSLVLQTAQRAADQSGRPVHAVGFGVSGARTVDVRTEQVPRIAPETDVVAVVIGSNDVTHLTPPWRMDDETAALIAAIRQQAPGAAVVLGGIPLFGEARALDEPLRSVVDAYATVLRDVQRRVATTTEGTTFVDIARDASPRFVGVPDAMSGDRFHPAATGYGFWADALAPAVAAAAG